MRLVQPPERLTAQELTYLATGARLLAIQARENAERQTNPDVRANFLHSERTYLTLAEKCKRLSGVATL